MDAGENFKTLWTQEGSEHDTYKANLRRLGTDFTTALNARLKSGGITVRVVPAEMASSGTAWLVRLKLVFDSMKSSEKTTTVLVRQVGTGRYQVKMGEYEETVASGEQAADFFLGLLESVMRGNIAFFKGESDEEPRELN